jgi:cytochrome c oxidase subunit I
MATTTYFPESVGKTEALPLPSRLHEWIVTVDHKRLGILYIATALVFFAVAGVLAALMRLQLAYPNSTFLPPEVFNRLLTMHGTTMVFLVGMPFFAGLANYLTPLMIGARDMAFPRLNAFGYWIFLFGGMLLYFSYVAGEGLAGHGSAPDVGWFAYAPLTERAFSRGTSTDYWILSIILTGIGTTASAINVIATIVSMRCKGMTLAKMPLFVWLMLVVSSMVLFILPPLTAGQIMLLLDRYLGAHFFDTQAGGSAVLWQHFFWLFGHPEVYVLCFGDHSRVFSQADVRPSSHDRSHGRHRDGVVRRVGASHVLSRDVDLVQRLLRSHIHGRRHTHRNQDLQLARNDVWGQDSVRHAHVVLHRFPFPVSDCRSDRSHARGGSV